MKTLPSSQFKTQYPHLTEPTMVTVNGHPIGTWTPLFDALGDFKERFPEAISVDIPRPMRETVHTVETLPAGATPGTLGPATEQRDKQLGANARAAQKRRDEWLRKSNG